MLRQVRRFTCGLDGQSGLEAVNDFLRQLHGAGVRSVEVQAVPGRRGSDPESDSIYVVFEPADEPDLLSAVAAEVAVEILEPAEVADAAGNGHGLTETDQPPGYTCA